MPEPSSPISVPQVLHLREQFEMGDGLFREITGIDVSALFGYRRGKLKERPTITETASARVKRCKELLDLATELTGSEEKALDWIYAESPTFGGRSPTDLTVSEAAVEVVRVYVAKVRAAVAAQTVTVQEAKTVGSPRAKDPAATTTNKTATRKLSPAISKPTKAAIPLEAPLVLPVVSLDRASAPVADAVPLNASVAPQRAPVPPPGVAPDARIFRLKESLAKIRASRPELTLRKISELMANRGRQQFASSSYMSRLANSYTWATWGEVVAMADALRVAPEELATSYTV